jgi:hypothetical protein
MPQNVGPVPRGRRAGQDTWRDPRGFALKLYNSEGNLDIVGNRTPIFFMRDPLKSQHFNRSQKRRADTGLRDHDMQWDFWTLSPESAHQVTWLMGDRGIPKTWRHMNRYSSDTYSWINTASLDSAERQCIRSERHVTSCRGGQVELVVWLAQMVPAMPSILGDHSRIRTGRIWRWCRMAPPPRRVRANHCALRRCRSRLFALTFGG